jgi:hypothetical protein
MQHADAPLTLTLTDDTGFYRHEFDAVAIVPSPKAGA